MLVPTIIVALKCFHLAHNLICRSYSIIYVLLFNSESILNHIIKKRCDKSRDKIKDDESLLSTPRFIDMSVITMELKSDAFN